MEAKHVSVLLQECIDALAIRPDGIYVDGTLGMGGHSAEIAKRLTTGTLIGVDRDETAIRRAGERLRPFGERVRLVHGNFRNTAAILDRLGWGQGLWMGCCSISGFRLRSSMKPTAAFRICTTRRWICAWTRRTI